MEMLGSHRLFGDVKQRGKAGGWGPAQPGVPFRQTRSLGPFSGQGAARRVSAGEKARIYRVERVAAGERGLEEGGH